MLKIVASKFKKLLSQEAKDGGTYFSSPILMYILWAAHKLMVLCYNYNELGHRSSKASLANHPCPFKWTGIKLCSYIHHTSFLIPHYPYLPYPIPHSPFLILGVQVPRHSTLQPRRVGWQQSSTSMRRASVTSPHPAVMAASRCMLPASVATPTSSRCRHSFLLLL